MRKLKQNSTPWYLHSFLWLAVIFLSLVTIAYQLLSGRSFELRQKAVESTPSIDTGLISYWKLDETSGSIVSDSIGGNTGTAAGTTIIEGKFNKARSFVHDKVSISDNPSLELGGSDFTISVWVNFSQVQSATNGPRNGILSKWGARGSFSYSLDVGRGDRDADPNMYLRFHCSGDGSSDSIEYNQPWNPSSNTWYHIAIVRSGNVIQHYVNGGRQGSDLPIGLSCFNSSSPLLLGTTDNGGRSVPKYDLNGSIDEIRLYKRALTVSEIQELFLGTYLTPTPTPSPTPTNTPTPTPTPTSTPTPVPTPTNTPTPRPTPTPTPVPIGGYGYPTFTPTPRPTSTPTPVASPSATIIPTETPRFPFFPDATPVPTPTPPAAPYLLVDSFTNSKKEAPTRFAITGKSDPFVQISVDISSDGFIKTVSTDTKGVWKIDMTKPLSKGSKKLIVTAVNTMGGSTSQTIPFTAVGGSSSFWFIVILLFILILAGYLLYRKYMQPPDYPSMPLPPESSPYAPLPPTPASSEGPEGSLPFESPHA